MMSSKERRRLLACQQVAEGRITVTQAAGMLSISTRQMRRSLARHKEAGDAGLVHASRGRLSNRASAPELKQAALARYAERYADFGPTLASEKLAGDGIRVDHETLRRWLAEAGMRRPRQRRARHRSARERKHRFGELVQMDGSHHDWFEGRAPRCCLMQMVDDATGVRMMLFAEQETTAAALALLKAWVERHGVPHALYTDRKTVYLTGREPTLEEQLAGKEPATVFGEVCEALGIAIVPAYSPQAKGRVERANGVAQDRLVKELRLSGASSVEEGNSLLAAGVLDTRFAVEPAEPQDAHRPLSADEDLDVVFRMRHRRTVANDYTLRFENRRIQILKQPHLPLPRAKVTVACCLDGRLVIEHEGRELAWSSVIEAPPPAHERTERALWAPAPDHPWRNPLPHVAARYASTYNSQEQRYWSQP